MARQGCPCGARGAIPWRRYRCDAGALRRYRARLSGPLLDRIDIRLDVPSVRKQDLERRSLFRGETDTARLRVLAARAAQAARADELAVAAMNARLTPAELERASPLTSPQRRRLASAMETLGLSARGFHRTWRLARTLADLDGRAAMHEEDLREALQMRRAGRDGAEDAPRVPAGA